jgi:hypothetical protein
VPTGAAGILTAAAALSASLGFLFSLWKNHRDSLRSREISARAAWEKYLELAFKHPRLAVGVHKDDKGFEEYEWFISLMLYAMEEVLLYVRSDGAWTATFKAQFYHHADYLRGDDFASYESGYAPELAAMLTAWDRECTVGMIIVDIARTLSATAAAGARRRTRPRRV